MQEPPESYHSLRFWAWLLRKDRAHLGQPLDAAVGDALWNAAVRLHSNWHVKMRYQPAGVLPLEAEEVLDDVDWLRTHYVTLWS